MCTSTTLKARIWVIVVYQIFQSWTMPYFMAAIDIPVVQRSNALMDFYYGKSFRYYESMATPVRAPQRLSTLFITSSVDVIVFPRLLICFVFAFFFLVVSQNLLYALLGYLATNMFGILALFSPFRWLVKSLIPQGTGPSEELQRTGYFNMHILGDGLSDGSRVATKGLVAAYGADPGYKLTAQMLCESALCLVLDAR